MLLVCNPNPAVDRVSVVDYRRGSTLRPIRHFEWAGGSGVHSAHVARRLGTPATVVAFVGGDYGRRFRQLVRDQAGELHAVESDAETRGTYSLLDRHDGNVVDVAELGHPHDPRLAADLLDVFEGLLGDAELVVSSGSVPPGIPPSLHRDVVRRATARGVRSIVDLTGAALLDAVAAGPWMLKSSLEELRRDGVMEVGDRHELTTAREWLDAGTEHVCVSLAERGTLWVSAEGVRRIWVNGPVTAYNSIGAGDTLVGATAARSIQGDDVGEALAWGVAAATVNLAYDEPGECRFDEVAATRERVEIADVAPNALAELLR